MATEQQSPRGGSKDVAKFLEEQYLNYNYSHNQSISVIEYLPNEMFKDSMAANKKGSLFGSQKLNEMHWSQVYAVSSQQHLRTINEKFQMWKKIMKPTGQFNFEVDVQLESEAPSDLFDSKKCHDLGSILLTQYSNN